MSPFQELPTACTIVMAVEFEESMPNARTQTTSHNLLLQTYISAVELVTWGVGPNVTIVKLNARYTCPF